MPKERQQATSGVETGVDVSGSIVLWRRADDTDVANTVTDMDWAVFDFPSGMDFSAIPSHWAKNASVKGSNTLESADLDLTDVRLDHGGVNIAGPYWLRIPLTEVQQMSTRQR